MATFNPKALALIYRHGDHFGGRRGNSEILLILVGLAFAGVLVWVIQRSGKPTA
jgi:hypothetical protein